MGNTYNGRLTLFWKKKTIISFFLSVLVVLRHVSTFSNYQFAPPIQHSIDVFLRIIAAVTPLAVPLFFILSGCVFFRNYSNRLFRDKLKKRFHSLVIPYLNWNFIYLIWGLITTAFLSKYFIGRQPTEFSVSHIIASILFYKENTHFWFIFYLIFCILLSPLFELLTRNKYVCSMVFLGIIILLQVNSSLHLFQVEFNHYNAFVQYFAGASIGRHMFEKIVNPPKKWIYLLSIFCFFTIATFFYLHEYNAFRYSQPGFCSLILTVYAISFYWVFDVFHIRKVYTFYNNSFLIYAMHGILLPILVKIFYLILPNQPIFAFMNYFLSVLLTISVICLFARISKKYTPTFYALLSGKRE